MKIRAALPLLALLPLAVASPAALAIDLEATFDAFYHLDLAEGGIPVTNVTLRRPDATFTLKSGVFVPARRLEGVVTGGVFLGEGEMKFRPSQAMDQAVLNARLQEWLGRSGREYGTTFQRMVVRFSDDTLEELGGAAAGAAFPPEAQEVWKQRNKILDDIQSLVPFLGNPWNLEMDFIERHVNGLEGRTFFVAEFDAGEDGWLTYSYNDTYTQEVFFGNHRSMGALEEIHPFALANTAEDFDDKGDYVADARSEDKKVLDTEHYRMTIVIPDTHKFTVDASVEFSPRVPLRTVRFDLVNNIRLEGPAKWTERGRPVDVIRVVDGEGNELPFIHKRHQLLVEYPEVLPAGETAVLGVELEEETIIQLTPSSYWLLNTYPWFPQYGWVGGRNTHEWVVKTNKPLVGVVSGKLLREWEEEGLHCTGWVMEEPVQFPSLIFGKFEHEEDTYVSELTGNEVKVRVYAYPALILNGINWSGVKKMKPVLREGMEILKFMEDLFGAYPYDYLNVAQMAPGLGFGQAPPGLVQLTGEAFLSQALLESDFFHEFYAHEIAHQWWAHGVWGDSFRDAWLSESFAEYAAGLYVQQYMGQNRFQAKMKQWRQSARNAEGAAPLAALPTLSGDMAPQRYTELIYNKGPYVVHMLRMLMGHEEWVEGMHRFFDKHRHTNVRTEALRAEMEQMTGFPLDFFFDQWFKGTGIPELEFAYDIQPTDDGRYLFTGTTRQSHDPPYKVLLPIIFHFDGDRVSVQNRPIIQQEDVYRVYLDEVPKKVVVDEFNTLLAEIKQGRADDEKEAKGKKRKKKKG